MKLTRHRLAYVLVWALSALLIWQGTTQLLLPPIYQQLHRYLDLTGYLMMGGGILLICFQRLVVKELWWLYEKTTRWISALLMAGAIGIDAMMHVFSIPHMEGWWLPIFGSGAVITALSDNVRKWWRKTKPE